ncbi:MAG: hypothetical protein HQ522_05565, partial [Bacteroidetes bacterium]|nr:hypothetical protein [Bacteroidota bacterium]
VMKPARMSKKAAEEAGLEEDALEKCEECSFPLIASFQRGKAPWRFCFNPKCKTNAELMKKKAEFKAKLASGDIEIGKDGKVIDHTKKAKKAVKKTKKVKKRKKAVKKAKKKA